MWRLAALTLQHCTPHHLQYYNYQHAYYHTYHYSHNRSHHHTLHIACHTTRIPSAPPSCPPHSAPHVPPHWPPWVPYFLSSAPPQCPTTSTPVVPVIVPSTPLLPLPARARKHSSARNTDGGTATRRTSTTSAFGTSRDTTSPPFARLPLKVQRINIFPHNISSNTHRRIYAHRHINTHRHIYSHKHIHTTHLGPSSHRYHLLLFNIHCTHHRPQTALSTALSRALTTTHSLASMAQPPLSALL
eukprot:GHVQ01017174.1.p1 GENE.GHVQ01017174.1~~GHVQ01017174.1.p1  ORF type:complete len:244 (-),score=27.59 GHVQ01017174.1:525-1256(-)